MSTTPKQELDYCTVCQTILQLVSQRFGRSSVPFSLSTFLCMCAAPAGVARGSSGINWAKAIVTTDMLSNSYLVRNRWKITGKLGQGSFGETYLAVDTQTREEVAVKVERSDSKKMVLKLEVVALKRLQACPYVVRYIHSGRQDDFNFLIMELLGENLAELRKRVPRERFSLSSTVRLGLQMLESLHGVHELGFLHRDIKPSNFVMGRPPNHRRCLIIDFGLARKYKMSNGEVRQARKTAGFRGTARYASVASHKSKELARRDDLWSLFYVLVEFGVGQLPWRKLRDKEQIGKLKEKLTTPDLVRDLPREFLLFMRHIEDLKYEDTPDYEYLKALLESVMNREGAELDDPYDWELLEAAQSNGIRPRPSGRGFDQSAGPGLTVIRSENVGGGPEDTMNLSGTPSGNSFGTSMSSGVLSGARMGRGSYPPQQKRNSPYDLHDGGGIPIGGGGSALPGVRPGEHAMPANASPGVYPPGHGGAEDSRGNATAAGQKTGANGEGADQLSGKAKGSCSCVLL